jgi:sporulation protein YlmC with PRC-barrel domain
MKAKYALQAVITAVAVSAGGLAAQAADTNTNTLSATSNERALGTIERADKIIGREVRNNSDQKIGKVDDLVVDLESGRVIYAVVSAGGFLGVGDRSVAVPTAAFTEQGKQLRLDIDKQKLMEAPEISKDDKDQLSPTFASKVSKFFGQRDGWWENTAGESGKAFGNVHKASDLIGMDIHNVSNQKIADVENVMVDLKAGRVPYVIISPEDSLNLKNNLYALPPNALTAAASEGKNLTSDLDQQKLASAPHFSKNDWPNFSDRSWAAKVYQYYGKQPYFEGSALEPTSLSGTNAQERIYHEPRKSNP